jgi:hypothetical protein
LLYNKYTPSVIADYFFYSGVAVFDIISLAAFNSLHQQPRLTGREDVT